MSTLKAQFLWFILLYVNIICFTYEHFLHYTLISRSMRLNSNKSSTRNGLLPPETCTNGSMGPTDVQDAGIERRRFRSS